MTRKKRINQKWTKEAYFLLLGTLLGIMGNFFVSAFIETVNVVIAPLSSNEKITLWMAVGAFSVYPIFWIGKIIVEAMVKAKIWGKGGEKVIKDLAFYQKYALAGGAILLALLLIQLLTS